MGATPIHAIPYIEPADLLADYPAADKAQAEKLDAALGGKPYCEAIATAVQAMTTSSEVAIVYQSSVASQAGMFTNGGSVITVPVAGLYEIILGYSYVANATGSRIVLLRFNGATHRGWAVPPGGAQHATGTLSVIRSLAAGTTVSMAQYQSSGASLNTHSQSYPSLTVARIGPPTP